MNQEGKGVQSGGGDAGKASGRLDSHILLPEVSLVLMKEARYGASTGSTDESGAVNGEEDGDPVLDCE